MEEREQYGLLPEEYDLADNFNESVSNSNKIPEKPDRTEKNTQFYLNSNQSIKLNQSSEYPIIIKNQEDQSHYVPNLTQDDEGGDIHLNLKEKHTVQRLVRFAKIAAFFSKLSISLNFPFMFSLSYLNYIGVCGAIGFSKSTIIWYILYLISNISFEILGALFFIQSYYFLHASYIASISNIITLMIHIINFCVLYPANTNQIEKAIEKIIKDDQTQTTKKICAGCCCENKCDCYCSCPGFGIIHLV